jgi:dienelactone hydrolase
MTSQIAKLFVFLGLFGAWTLGLPQTSPYVQTIHSKAGSSATNAPFVILLPGSGGGLSLSRHWAQWFSELGIHAVIVDSLRMRGLANLLNVSYEGDVSTALNAVRGDEKLDFSRYAVMGFSKGGTAALDAGKHLAELEKPAFIFALYPGDSGWCSHSHAKQTAIHIFYGEDDDWGHYQGTRRACQNLAQADPKVTFHSFPHAHHGYDGTYEGRWSCCGRTFLSKPDAQALQKTRQTIQEHIAKSWGIAPVSRQQGS